jgi:PAS domain S-box-containing protein
VICFKEPDGRWRMVNRRGSEVLGRSPARILGRRDADIFPPDFAERSREEDRQVQRRGQPMTFETDLPLPGGGSALYVVTKFPVTGADGTPDGIGMIASDISEIRRGEADRKRLGAIVQSAWDAIIAKDTEGRITTWNPSAERMFGLPEEQALGRMYEDVAVAPEEQDLYRELYARVRAGATVEVRMSGRRADGTLFPTAVSAAPLAAPDGSYTGIVATVRDISARVEAELALRERAAQLERSNADLEAFAYAASHDLQEPLRSINLSAEVLLRATAERLDDDERMLLSEVEAAAARMADQVGALMEVARVSLGRAPEEPVPAALALDDAIGALVAAIHESGAQIELTSQLPSTMMPRVELALVLQNVLANAIKYRRPDLPPQIRVSGSEGEEHVEIRIADNGIGMSRRDLAHIFSIFGRAQEGVPGTGMGLAVTRRVLGRRGGSISATSPGIGQGSEFILTLPAGGG